MSERKFLIIDNDPDLLKALSFYFTQMGYQVHQAEEGKSGLHQLYQVRPDLVLLDIRLPDLDGWEVLQRIRKISNVPIIILSCLGQESNRVRGLKMGADDYVSKPFHLKELGARVKAVLRRSQPVLWPNKVLYADDYLVICDSPTAVFCKGTEIHLTNFEWSLLSYLVRNQGQLLTARQIFLSVWGPGEEDQAQYVRSLVYRLRQRIEPDPKKPRYILTVHGQGFRFAGKAKEQNK